MDVGRPHQRTRFPFILGILTTLACTPGCGEAPPGTHLSRIIGPEGETLALGSGALLEIPPGALAQTTAIAFTQLTPPNPSTPGFTAVGPFHRLTPEGQAFLHPVSVYLPFSTTEVGEQADDVRIISSGDDGRSWNTLPLLQHPSAEIVGGQTTHFSLFVAALPWSGSPDPSEGGGAIPGAGGEEGGEGDPDTGCTASSLGGCGGCPCESDVCSVTPACCADTWNDACVQICTAIGGCGVEGKPEGGGDGSDPDSCEGHCDGIAPGGCRCDSLCVQLGDCCKDACQSCAKCPPLCGDGICGDLESCSGCPLDCGACSLCGDGTCSDDETCSECPNDCGQCMGGCGDGVCTGWESCDNCVMDCGACAEDGSCAGVCGEQAAEGCWCDMLCLTTGDCCPNACTICSVCP